MSGRTKLQQDMEHEAAIANCVEGLIQTELGVGSIERDSYTRMARGSLFRASKP